MSLMQLMLDLEGAAELSSAAGQEPTPLAAAEPAGPVPPPDSTQTHPQAGKPAGELALYVSTTLEAWDTDEPQVYARDVTLDGVCYRRLDPEYYAWLRNRMTMAKAAAEAGKLLGPAFDRLREAFNVIHAWAAEHLGDKALAAAVGALDAKIYLPPVAQPLDQEPTAPLMPCLPQVPAGHCYPHDGDWPFFHEVTQEAVAKVDAIRDQALQHGWTESALYQNRGHLRYPYGQDYGLVCCLGREAK